MSNSLHHMNCSMPVFTVLHYLLEFAQTHVHWVEDAIQPSYPLSPPSPPVLNPSQHQGLCQRVYSSHHVAKGLELLLQHQSFPWIFKIDFLEDWLVWSCCSSGSQESSPTPQFKTSLLWRSAFLMVQLPHSYMTTGKTSFEYMNLWQQRDVSAL